MKTVSNEECLAYNMTESNWDKAKHKVVIPKTLPQAKIFIQQNNYRDKRALKAKKFDFAKMCAGILNSFKDL